MSIIAKLRARTGEEIEVRYTVCSPLSLPDAQDSWFVTADDIEVYVEVPENRELPDAIELEFIAYGAHNELYETPYKRFDRTLVHMPGSRQFQTGIPERVTIVSGDPGGVRSQYQSLRFNMLFGEYSEALICPINGTSIFNISMDMAQFS